MNLKEHLNVAKIKNNKNLLTSQATLRKEIIKLASAKLWHEVHNKLALLIQALSLSASGKKKLTKLRRSVSKLLYLVSAHTQPVDNESKNFLVIVTFLRCKFLRTHRRKPVALSTIATYLEQLKNTLKFVQYKDKEFHQLNEFDLREFKESSPSSLRILKELISWIRTNKGIDSEIDMEDPSLCVRKNRSVVEFIDLEVGLSNLENLARNEILAVLLAYDTFLRLSEIARLKTEDIVLSLFPEINVMGKGAKQRFVPLIHFPRVFGILKKVLPQIPTGYLICKSNGQPYSKAGIRKIIKRVLKKLNIPDTHVHFLRHLGINNMLIRGFSLTIVSSISGHAQLETTIASYLHVQGLLAKRALPIKDAFFSELFNIREQALTSKEAAEILQSSIRTPQMLAKKGVIEAHRSGGEWSFNEANLIEYKLKRAGICCL